MKKTRLIMPNISNVRKTTFEGNPWYNLMGMLYLNKKYIYTIELTWNGSHFEPITPSV